MMKIGVKMKFLRQVLKELSFQYSCSEIQTSELLLEEHTHTHPTLSDSEQLTLLMRADIFSSKNAIYSKFSRS